MGRTHAGLWRPTCIGSLAILTKQTLSTHHAGGQNSGCAVCRSLPGMLVAQQQDPASLLTPVLRALAQLVTSDPQTFSYHSSPRFPENTGASKLCTMWLFQLCVVSTHLRFPFSLLPVFLTHQHFPSSFKYTISKRIYHWFSFLKKEHTLHIYTRKRLKGYTKKENNSSFLFIEGILVLFYYFIYLYF